MPAELTQIALHGTIPSLKWDASYAANLLSTSRYAFREVTRALSVLSLIYLPNT